MIHEYILQPEEFQKDYVVWDKSRPSSAQQEKFCQALASSLEIEPNRAVLDAYKQAYSTRGKSEDLMISEGLKIASTLKDYIDFLKSNDGRKMIGPWDVKMLEKIKHNIQSHKLANMIINPCFEYKDKTLYLNYVKNYHEFHINWEWEWKSPSNSSFGDVKLPVEGAVVKCKSLLDGLTLDFEHKKAIIYDLKTTQKLWHFEDSIDQYDYLRQLAYYTMAVKWYIYNELGDKASKWDFEYYIIGIDTTGSYEIRAFEIDEDVVKSRNSVIEKALCDIAWHQSTGKWEHSRAYYEGDGSESLNL